MESVSERRRKPFGLVLVPQNESEAARLLGQIKAAQENVEDLRRAETDEIAEIKTITEIETAPPVAGVSISQTETFVVKPEGGSGVVIRLHKRRKRWAGL